MLQSIRKMQFYKIQVLPMLFMLLIYNRNEALLTNFGCVCLGQKFVTRCQIWSSLKTTQWLFRVILDLALCTLVQSSAMLLLKRWYVGLENDDGSFLVAIVWGGMFFAALKTASIPADCVQ